MGFSLAELQLMDLYDEAIESANRETLSKNLRPTPPEERYKFPKLSPEQLKMMYESFEGNPRDTVAKKYNWCLQRKEIISLKGIHWVEDKIIDYYLMLIMIRAYKKNLPSVFCMNTKFYQLYAKKGYESVKNWTKDIDLFSFQLICIPVRRGNHWFLVVIDFITRVIKSYDTYNGSHTKYLEKIRDYLGFESSDKKKKQLRTHLIPMYSYNIDRAISCSDCGVVICSVAEFITRECKVAFCQADLPYLRQKMIVEILTGDLLE